MINKKLFIIVNTDYFFISHRLPIALAAKESGYEVTVLTRNTGKRNEIEKVGLNFIEIPFERASINPFKEFKIYRKLKNIYKREQPEIVHHVTLKPIILGNFAAKSNPNISIVNAISGLGILFSRKGSKVKKTLALILIRFAFKLTNRIIVIFQNKEDRSIFVDNEIIDKKNTVMIKGSGVDINKFGYVKPKNKKRKRVFMAARLLYPKGFEEFYLMAKHIIENEKMRNVDFVIAGDIDDINPLSISESTVSGWEKSGNIRWIGFVEDMKKEIAESDIIVFPSFYGEGLPKFLIEACAIGRPIITTDHPGCRDCVEHGKNGYLVPVKDYLKMSEYLKNILSDLNLQNKLGKYSRRKAENEFGINLVINAHLKIYEELVKGDN